MYNIKKILLALAIAITTSYTYAQQTKNNKWLKGMYLQWGYNTEWYTKSTIHFTGSVNGIPHNFTIYNAKAHDRTDISGLWEKPTQVTIPQYNYRIGFYLNAAKTKAIELNFDHTKYIVDDYQTLHAKGFVGNKTFDKDTLIDPTNFMHFEHTNGANFYHINYVQFWPCNKLSKPKHYFVPMVKLGLGFMIPKTDVTLFGKRLDNRFHIAGYMASVEGGVKYYISKRFFAETTAKTGYANYTNALTVDGGKAQHSFGYIELIGTVGYDINW